MKYFWVLLCVFALASVKASAECVPALVKPCECVRFTYVDAVQCTNFTEMESLQSVFDSSVDHPFEGFILQESNLMYLKASWLTTQKIRQIVIRNSSLASFFDEPPSSDNLVSHIYLHNVRVLRGILWEDLKALHRLLDLVVQDVEVRKIGKNLSENLTPTLRKIKLKGTKTTELEDTAFQVFKELDWFELQNARVKTLKRSMFANPSRLWTFDFRNNRIETLPNDMFSNIERLTNIYLSGNKLVTLPAAVFSNAYETSLFELEVQENPLQCDCTISWLVFSTRYVDVEGYCSSPANLKDRHLLRLTREEFKYCPQAIQRD